MTTLSDLLDDVQSGFACGKEDLDGIFQFRMNNISKTCCVALDKRRRVPRNSHKRIELFAVRPDDVLFNATNSPDGVGKSALVPDLDEPAVFSNHFLRLRPRDGVLSASYLWRWLQLQYQRGVFQGLCRQWVNQATVSRESLLGLDMPVPAIEEQRRICSILDRSASVASSRNLVIDQLKELAESIFEQNFSDGAWRERPLADLVAEGTAVTYGIVQAGAEFEGGVPYIRTGDIDDGEINTSELRRTDPRIAENFLRSEVRSGDIVMSIRATVGTTAVVPSSLDGANLTQGTARIAPGESVLGSYLLGYLRSTRAQQWIQAQVKGATFREITLGRLREMPIPVPPLSRQTAFAKRIKKIDALHRSAKAALAMDKDLFCSLQSRAFRGEL